MLIAVESKARPCPGVERAIALAEDLLRRGEVLYTIGQLIHNRREVERLEGLGLKQINPDYLSDKGKRRLYTGKHFLVRAHGEQRDILNHIQAAGMHVVDATCPIVRHSQELVEQHVREGWRIIITGDITHPEVVGLMARAGNHAVVISSAKEIEGQDLEDRSLLMAQTTMDPILFAEIRRILFGKLPGLKIVDTTCRFLRTRQNDIAAFAREQDILLLVSGKNSSNGRLLFHAAKAVNKKTILVEGPSEIETSVFRDVQRIGISGGASTPRWQLEEMRLYLENHKTDDNPKRSSPKGSKPKGLKNKKGGKILWWMRKNQNKPE
jgi:4-hydroxy-3-methylbut-2-enyl diphosphate reductase